MIDAVESVRPARSLARATALLLVFFTAAFSLAFAPTFLAGRTLATGDALDLVLPAYAGPEGLWSTAIDSGFPTFAAPTAQTWYPLRWLARGLGGGIDAVIVAGHLLAATFAGAFVLAVTGSLLAALVTGITFSLSSMMMVGVADIPVVHSGTWLPLQLLALHRLAHGGSPAWVGICAMALGLGILGGHPQLTFYGAVVTAAYGLFLAFGTEPRAGKARFLLQALGCAVFGVGLAAIQIVPTAELLGASQRVTMPPEGFFSFSLPVLQLPMLVFPFAFGGGTAPLLGQPYFGRWTLGTVAGYVGILPLILAALACRSGSRAHRTEAWFWAAIAGFSLAAALGPDTPLGHLLLHVPGYSAFRCQGRHLMIWSLAIAVLAGLGTRAAGSGTAAERGRAVRDALLAGGGLVALAYLPLLAGASMIAARALDRGAHWSCSPLANPAIAMPLVAAALGSLALLGWAREPGRGRGSVMLAVLLADLLSFDFAAGSFTGGGSRELPRLRPDLAQLRARLIASGGRLLPLVGVVHRADLLAPNFPRLWDLPCVSGYEPMSLAGYGQLLRMDYTGIVQAATLEDRDRVLDMLSTEALTLPAASEIDARAYARLGFPWAWCAMATVVDGTAPEVRLGLPRVEARELAVVGALVGSGRVGPGVPVIEVLVGREGARLSLGTLRAEVELGTSESPGHTGVPDWAGPSAVLFGREFLRTDDGSAFESRRWIGSLPIPPGSPLTGVEVRWIGPADAGFRLDYLSLRDSQGAGYPIGLGHLLDATIRRSQRWRLAQALPGLDLFQNLRALPRVRLADRELVLPEARIGGVLNGTELVGDASPDLSMTVVVAESLGLASADPSAVGTVTVDRFEPWPAAMRVHALRPCLLVIGDPWYPGWWATVDGRSTPVLRVNKILQAIRIEPGEHRVERGFTSTSLMTGALLSLFSAGLLVVLALRPLTPPDPGSR